MPKLTWDDIFKKFSLDHSQLNQFTGEDLSIRDRQLKDNSHLHTKDNGSICYRPYNVVRPLILNDFMNVSLAPIPGLDLDKFVDLPKFLA